MAWIFSLSAECGPNKQDAETFRDYFQGLSLTLADGREVRCSADTFDSQDRDGNWWTVVIPEGMVIGGKDADLNLRKKERATEVGFLLYERLKSAPPFRHAMVGLEVDGFLEESELEPEALGYFDGVVISKEICERLNYRDEVEEFAPNYYWRPYQGEKEDL